MKFMMNYSIPFMATCIWTDREQPAMSAEGKRSPHHGYQERGQQDSKKMGKEEEEEEEEEDFFNVAIQRSGCSEEHYALQDCFADTGDWRKCHREMAQFKMCMDKHKKPREGTN